MTSDERREAFLAQWRPDQEMPKAIFDEFIAPLIELGQGCGNSGCRVKTPAGMATNGPCSCIQKLKDALAAFDKKLGEK